MRRLVYEKLLKWKRSSGRKPLMMYGARQVGKTYILKEFGRCEFSNMVYVNCYRNQAVKTLFSEDVSVKRILLGLSAICGEEIVADKTFVFLDEVQEIPEVVAALKYFCEDAPEVHIAVAGSLLGVMNMTDISFPTGKVDIMHLYPMTFVEFLYASGEEQKADLLRDGNDTGLINSLLPQYTDLLRQYYFVGGMPEAVAAFVGTHSLAGVRKIQSDILTAYEADIAKHAGPLTQKTRMVFLSIPSQLAKENRKFVFGALKKGARAADYEEAIQWLVDAGLVYKIQRVTKAAMPLKFYMENSAFKLFLLDVGLLGAMSEVPPSQILVGDNIFTEYKGAFTENYVVTQIVGVESTVMGYYSKDNSTMEIDLIVQCGDRILPVEVKAEENVRSRSLHQFITVDNKNSGLRGYRFSMKRYMSQDWMDNIPLCGVGPFMERIAQKDQ